MPVDEKTKIEHLEKEIAKLKVHVQILEEYLTTANTVPILGPARWPSIPRL
jgi:hypothetical protein